MQNIGDENETKISLEIFRFEKQIKQEGLDFQVLFYFLLILNILKISVQIKKRRKKYEIKRR